MHEQIIARHRELAALGIELMEFGVDIRANKERVGVKGLTSRAREVLAREFGADLVEVVKSSGATSYRGVVSGRAGSPCRRA